MKVPLSPDRLDESSLEKLARKSEHRALVYSAVPKELEPRTASMSRSACMYVQPSIRIEEREELPLDFDSVRIRPLRLGICGTDLHLMEITDRGLVRCTSPFSIPPQGRVIGHEGVAVVEEIGSGVKGFQVGDYVCSESIQTCGHCRPCRQGQFNQCDHSTLLGLQIDGLFAEQAVVSAGLLHRVNDLVHSASSLDGLACVEPAAVAFLALKNADVQAGQSVLVVGGGPIGHLSAWLAREFFGASSVVLTEPSEFRRQHAEYAADLCLHPDELHSLGRAFDVIIEAAGALEAIDGLITRMRPNGRIVLLARTGTSLSIRGVDEMITKSIRIMGSRGHLGGAFDAILELIRSDRIDLGRIVTRRVQGLAGIAEVMNDPVNSASMDCKIIAELGTTGTYA
jgi:2-desacetyl-2-hydroxyethyl bacteriochlorophyllide A dehydrogenase